VEEKLLTPDDLATRWGVHKATVLRLFHTGELPGVTISRGKERTTVRFRPSVVEAWEKKREKAATQVASEADQLAS
jgi:excisionase family DNA binding protein